MDKYRIGDLVSAKLGTLPVVGTVLREASRSGLDRSGKTGSRQRTP